jgi:nicotinate dehydrogenase subunit B
MTIRSEASIVTERIDDDTPTVATLTPRDIDARYRWPAIVAEVNLVIDVHANRGEDHKLLHTSYRISVPPSAAPAAESGTFAPTYHHEQHLEAPHGVAQHTLRDAYVFARESFVDEAAHAARTNPVAYRLAQLEPGARNVIRMVSERGAWSEPRLADPPPAASALRGRGFAFHRAEEPSDDHAFTPTWSAWIVDLAVDRRTGDIAIDRLVAGGGSGEPDTHALHSVSSPRIAQTISRLMQMPLAAEPAFDETPSQRPSPLAAVAYRVTSPQKRQGDHSITPSTPTSFETGDGPLAAAIANALFDATGVRFREPPFSRDRILAGLNHTAIDGAHVRSSVPKKSWLKYGAIGSLFGVALAMFVGPKMFAPLASGEIDASAWSAATIERGRQVAIAADCAVCHTAPGGIKNAGGLPLDTPFGVIYSTNLTPDRETGIGMWSYPAFARAMREGISRDGKHLYPAFPYTSFAKISEPDMLALYAYLMSQTPVRSLPPDTRLPFPLNLRSSVAGWNWLFHDARPFVPDPHHSALWNRGKYLVDGAGHCGACHTPRNALGAERSKAYLMGGHAEGWDAPPLVGKRGPVPWTEDALFDYLRSGFSKEHGVAAGPMGPVVAGLSELPAADVRAIAHYLASLSPPVDADVVAKAAQARSATAELVATPGMERGKRAFETACAVCHEAAAGVGHFGVRPLMALNTSVGQTTPDNLLRVLHYGIDDPATDDLGYMPGFADVFDDQQMAELAAYVRARYAPDQPPWKHLEKASSSLRTGQH